MVLIASNPSLDRILQSVNISVFTKVPHVDVFFREKVFAAVANTFSLNSGSFRNRQKASYSHAGP